VPLEGRTCLSLASITAVLHALAYDGMHYPRTSACWRAITGGKGYLATPRTGLARLPGTWVLGLRHHTGHAPCIFLRTGAIIHAALFRAMYSRFRAALRRGRWYALRARGY